jgi:hypothetical protein
VPYRKNSCVITHSACHRTHKYIHCVLRFHPYTCTHVHLFMFPQPKQTGPAGDPTPIAECSSLSSRITLNEREGRSRSPPKEASSTSPLWAVISLIVHTSFFLLYLTLLDISVHPRPCLIPSAELYDILLIYPFSQPHNSLALLRCSLRSSIARFFICSLRSLARDHQTPGVTRSSRTDRSIPPQTASTCYLHR